MKPEGVVNAAALGGSSPAAGRRLRYAAAVGLLFVAVAVFLPMSVITVRLPRKNDVLVSAVLVGSDRGMLVEYVHSVERTRVRGLFHISTKGDLMAFETWMESTGTGMPNVDPARTRREEGWIVVDEQLKVLDRFPMFFQPINELRLSATGRELSLAGVKAGDLLHIGVEKTPLWRWLAYRVIDKTWPPPEKGTQMEKQGGSDEKD